VNSALITIILGTGLAVIAVRRRSVGIGLVATQSLTLSVAAFTVAGGRSASFLVASVVLAVKAIILPMLLWALMRRTREPRLVAAARGPVSRLAAASALSLLVAVTGPPIAHTGTYVEHAAIALVLIGIAIVASRRPALHQLLGVIVAENGCSLLAVAVPGGLSYVIEMGALFDLVLVVTVAAAFVQRIHVLLGTGNTELLRGLRD
jgi:hydrogenase-4 component E